MNEIVFFSKLFFLTVAIVLVMQIQVGERTLESHAMGWVQTSILVEPLNSVAHGGARMVRDLSQTVHSSIKRTTTAKHKQAEEKKKTPSSSSAPSSSSSSSFHWGLWHRRNFDNENVAGKN